MRRCRDTNIDTFINIRSAYIFHEIQNELMKVVADHIAKQVVADTNRSVYYSVIALSHTLM